MCCRSSCKVSHNTFTKLIIFFFRSSVTITLFTSQIFMKMIEIPYFWKSRLMTFHWLRFVKGDVIKSLSLTAIFMRTILVEVYIFILFFYILIHNPSDMIFLYFSMMCCIQYWLSYFKSNIILLYILFLSLSILMHHWNFNPQFDSTMAFDTSNPVVDIFHIHNTYCNLIILTDHYLISNSWLMDTSTWCHHIANWYQVHLKMCSICQNWICTYHTRPSEEARYMVDMGFIHGSRIQNHITS